MSINPSTVGHNTFDLLDGSVSAFYADVDEAIVASEVVKGQYRMTINPAYNSPNPVSATSFTTVGLTQSGPMVVDLDNSYITTEAEMIINITNEKGDTDDDSTATRFGIGAWFFGWKSSIEAIERYDILVNNTPIYTQSFCGEESFIQNMVRNDLVKNTTPYTYSPWENVAEMSPNVAGVYVQVPANQNTLTLNIPLKIPIDNFLILKNLKYLLSWMGKWEIRLFFSAQNMVVCPIRTTVATSVMKNSGCTANTDCATWYRFTQMNDSFYSGTCVKKDTTDSYIDHPVKCTVKCSEMTLKDVEMNTAAFQIRGDILELLKSKYLSDRPLTFPVSTLAISRFTGAPYTAKQIAYDQSMNLSIVLCQAINNCDTMFILPFRKAIHHTICRQPYVEGLQLHAGEYGAYPTQPFDTFPKYKGANIRFVNYIADALNVNASELCSFSKSVARNFTQTTPLQSYDGGSVITRTKIAADDTDFFIAFPFSTDDDFQGGLSSPASNINFKVTGTIHNLGEESITNETPWVAAFLIDGVIMIRPDPGSDAAKVIWSDRTVC